MIDSPLTSILSRHERANWVVLVPWRGKENCCAGLLGLADAAVVVVVLLVRRKGKRGERQASQSEDFEGKPHGDSGGKGMG